MLALDGLFVHLYVLTGDSIKAGVVQVRAEHGDLFPTLPVQSEFNRWVR
ncbi:hypothetical protein [Nocardia sp. NPDC051570]